MPIAKSIGNHHTDPWIMFIGSGSNATKFATHTSASGTANSSQSTFWTNYGAQGTNVDTNFTADTYKTIFTDTGKGLVASMLGPAASNAGTTTFEITLDGTVYTIPVSVIVGERAVVGNVAIAGGFNSDVILSTPLGTPDATRTQWGVLTPSLASGVTFHNWITLTALATPCLVYQSSFQLRIKHSADVTDTTSQGRQSGLQYRKSIY